MDATPEIQVQPSDDALTEFGVELDALIRRWSERTGGKCEMTSRTTLVDEPPVDGFHQFRRGPLVEISLTVVDMSRADELLDAYFPAPAAVRMLVERVNRTNGSQADRVNPACSA